MSDDDDLVAQTSSTSSEWDLLGNLGLQKRVVAAIKSGGPITMGERIPEWTPESNDPPPDELHIPAYILRAVLTDRELAKSADPDGLTIRGAIVSGVLDLSFATIEYPLRLFKCRFTDTVNFDRAALRSLELDESHFYKYIRVSAARIAGPFSLTDATIEGKGISLSASLARIEDVVSLDGKFTTSGAVYLREAHVVSQLIMRDAHLNGTDKEGNSLAADGMHADGLVILEFVASGAVRIGGSRFGSQLSFRGTTISGIGEGGNSLIANNVHCETDLFLDEGFTAAGTVWLRSAEIGNLAVGKDQASLPQLGEATGWRLRDIHGVIRGDRQAARAWLSAQKTAQPWQEIAAAYERNGQPADARWLRYKSAVNSTQTAPLLTRIGRQAYRWTTGHGYYPMAALFWLLLIFAVAWGFADHWSDNFTTTTTTLIRDDLKARSQQTSEGTSAGEPQITGPPFPGRAPAAWCNESWDVPCFQPGLYALATAFPASATVQPWSPPGNGWHSTAIFYVLRLLAWVFTALLLAGVTGLLRKQT